MHDHYDILIVGAGLVGASLALSLQATPLRAAIVENNSLQPKIAIDQDGRSLALTYGSARFLEKLAVWPELLPHATAINTVHVSHRGHLGMTRIHARDESVPALGYVIPANILGAHLHQALINKDNKLTLFNPAKIQSLTKEGNVWQATLETSAGLNNITADLVVAADGAQSSLRALHNIKTITHDYEQSAIATTIQLTRSHQNVAYERFVEDGAIAMLPRADNSCGHVWTGAREKIAELMTLSDGEYLKQAQQYFGYRLGRFVKLGQRFTYPLKMVTAAETVREGFVLVGNAAHTIHPIAAQGFNLGLNDVMLLTQTINNTIKDKKNLGDLAVLQQYAEQRAVAQKNIIKIADGLTTLFAREFLPLNLATTAGLLSMDIFPPLKHTLARQMMGISS